MPANQSQNEKDRAAALLTHKETLVKIQALKKNPEFMWFYGKVIGPAKSDLHDRALNTNLKRKERERAAYAHASVKEIADWMDEQEATCIQAIDNASKQKA